MPGADKFAWLGPKLDQKVAGPQRYELAEYREIKSQSRGSISTRSVPSILSSGVTPFIPESPRQSLLRGHYKYTSSE